MRLLSWVLTYYGYEEVDTLIRSKVVGVGQMRASHAVVIAAQVGVHDVVEKLYREVVLV